MLRPETKEKLLLNYAFPLADRLMGTCAMKWYRQIVSMNSWSKQEIQDWQNDQLKKLVRHAYDHTVYYKEIMDGIGIKPDDIRCLDDIKLLPILDRETIKHRFNDLIPNNIQKYPHRKGSTGGSTGEPM